MVEGVVERPSTRGKTGREFEDHLTGLPNRRFLDRSIDALISEGTGFALLFIDLDNFKTVNDTRGHLCGDQVLEQFAVVLRSTVRDSDIVGRFGGDEFVVLARVDGDADAEALAGRLANRTEATLGIDWGVTASIGLVFYPDEARSKRDLLSLADQAMYTAKNTGRSRWCRSRTMSRDLLWSEASFINRAPEFARLMPLLSGDSTSCLIVVCGESGVGKTALINEAVRRGGMPLRRMSMSCRPEFSDIPFAPLIGAIRQASASMGVPVLPPQWARVLGTILPDVFSGSGSVEGPLERVVLMEALTALLSRWKPMLVTVEDAHWIDSGTAGFLLYLLHFAPDAGIPVLCAIRTDEEPAMGPGHPAEALLTREGTLVLDLAPFNRSDISDLARVSLGAASVSEDLTSTIYRISGGNPLFALEFLRTLHDSGQLVMKDSLCIVEGSIAGPPTRKIRDIITAKLSKLSQQERLTLVAAAAAGGVFDQALLSKAVSLSEGDVITALDRAARMGILVQDQTDPLLFGFRNLAYRDEIALSATEALTRSVNLAFATKYLDEGLHRQAALCLQNAGEESRAADAWISAGFGALGKKLVEEAAACFERADSILAGMPENTETIQKLLVTRDQLHNAHLQTGNLQRSRAFCISAAALAARLGRQEEELSLLSKAGDILRINGRTEEALEEQRVLEPRAKGEILFRICLRGLDAASRIGNNEEAGRFRKTATSLWKHLRQERRDLDANYYHKLVLHYLCNMDLEHAERAMRRALASPYPEDMGWYLFNDLGEVLMLKGRPLQAIRAFETGREAALAQPSLWGWAWTTINTASAFFHRLRFEKALAMLEEVREIIERTTDEPARSCMTLLHGRILLEKGDTERASALFEQSFSKVNQTSRDYFRSLVHSASGRWKEALDCAEAVIRLAEVPGRRLQLESGTLLTTEECLVQLHRARIDAGIPGALDGLAALIPMLRYKSRTRAQVLLASRLQGLGRTAEADTLMKEASSDPSIRQETLALYSLNLAWGRWNSEAAARVRSFSSLMST